MKETTIIMIASIALLFWFPYFIVMLYGAKNQRVKAIIGREKMLQELAFAGCSLALEERKAVMKLYGKELTWKDTNDIAVKYVTSKCGSVKPLEAGEAVRSILGKVKGAGASGSERICSQ